MTAPTPSSPQPGRPSGPEPGRQPLHDPWAARPPAPEDVDTPERGGPTGEVVGASDLWQWILTAVAVTTGGVLLGLLWWWLAPDVAYISDGRDAFLRDSESEDSFGVQGTFALLAAALGVLSGLVAFLLRRAGGVGVVLGLASGGVLGSWAGAWFGGLLGPDGDLTARAVEAGRGGVFSGPLELSGWVLWLLWPLAALTTHLLLVAAFGPREAAPRVLPQAWGTPQDPPPKGASPQDRPPNSAVPPAPQHPRPQPPGEPPRP
ncbi:hypothetical protein [Streptomyces chumphonensis]|uniref:hypothetical protein n=1 Tax=Streptomyces chumphonensis TaxID=1214925 RepID=UPI003D704237